LKKKDIVLNEVIKYGTQFDGINILPNDFISNEDWNDNEQDYEAMKLQINIKIIFALEQLLMETVF
jgi:hypothetical protein